MVLAHGFPPRLGRLLFFTLALPFARLTFSRRHVTFFHQRSVSYFFDGANKSSMNRDCIFFGRRTEFALKSIEAVQHTIPVDRWRLLAIGNLYGEPRVRVSINPSMS